MAKWIIIFVIVISILYFAYTKLRKIEDSIDYVFTITNIEGNLSQVISYFGSDSDKSNVDISYHIDITNKSGLGILIKNVDVSLFYENTLVAITPDNITNDRVDLKGDGNGLSAYDSKLKLLINKASINLVTAILAGQSVNIGYTIKAGLTKVGIPIHYTSVFQYKKA